MYLSKLKSLIIFHKEDFRILCNESLKHLNMRSLTIFIVITLCLLTACTGSEDDKQEYARVQIYLTDAPVDYQEVNIDVVSVRIIINDSLISLPTNAGIYNILDFVNGRDTLLVEDEIPAGYLSQIRLVLGERNSVMRGNLIHNLKTPSAQQSGLKLNVHENIHPGMSYAYVLDFEAEKSIVTTGNEKHLLKPVIRVFTKAVSGTLEGVSWPPEAKAYISVISAEDTVGTSADVVTGEFMVRGLTEGTYDIDFESANGFADTTLTDVFILAGQVTRLDTMKLRSIQ